MQLLERDFGIHRDLAMGEYHKLDAWGSSSLKAMRRGPPARVVWERENPLADTDAMRLGTAVHALALTPDLYTAAYAHKPDGMSFATKEGKAWRDCVEDGKIILPHDVALQVGQIVAAVLQHTISGEAIAEASHKEVTFLWKCSTSGETCKGRPDWIEGRYIYDLKVSRHAEGRALAYRAYVEGWMHQLAHYRTGAMALGLDVIGGRLVVVTPKEPHFVYTLEVKTEALNLLELENLATLRAMHECRVAGDWPGTPESWTLIEPPPNALVQFGEMTFDPGDLVEEGV
jgi:hypothetical protein